MIKKIYRLSENEVKKVLKFSKPFFSYNLVANTIPNNLSYHRFAIIIWGKSVKNSVERNFFRRRFYDMVESFIALSSVKSYDIVFVLKKQTKLDKKDFHSISWFEKDIQFLLKKIIL